MNNTEKVDWCHHDSQTSNLTTQYFMQLGPQQGWQCPICKRVLAPFITECPCKGQGPETHWTTTTSKENCYPTSYTSGSSTTMPMSDYMKALSDRKKRKNKKE